MIRLNRICPICSNSLGNQMASLDFENAENNSLPEHYDVVVCTECGFAYSDMVASQDDYNNYYSVCNNYSEAESIKNAESKNDPRFLYVVDILKRTVPFETEIIDIGCGGGELLLDLKEAGYNKLCGLDPSEKSISVLKERGFKAITANLFDPIDISYDVVISTAVIEHIYDLNMYVNKLKSYTKAGGYVLLNAPAVEGFPIAMTPFANNFNQEHINYFSSVSLDNLMSKYGFSRCNADPYFADGYEKNQLISIYRNDNTNGEIIRDEISAHAIFEYLEKYKEEKKHQEEKLRNIMENEERIVIFGTGSFTMQLLKEYPNLKEMVLFFVDNNTNKQGSILCGKEIKSVEAVKHILPEILILICSMRNSRDIEEQLRKMSISNRVVSLIERSDG